MRLEVFFSENPRNLAHAKELKFSGYFVILLSLLS